jgi:hypothetical protein
MALGLSAEALENRRGFVMASDAKPIMEGEWRKIWRLKKGLDAEDDLSGVLPVQMGSMTEPFNAFWFAKTTGRRVDYYSGNTLMQMIYAELAGRVAFEDEFQRSPEYPWMACSLDAMSITSKGDPCVLDFKHVGTFNYNTLADRYLASMTHQATVMGVDHWALSVLVGNSKLEVIEQEVDWLYQAELIEKTRAFWDLVERDEEPDEVAPKVEPPKPQPRLRVVHLDDDCRENWAGEAIDLIRTFATTDEAHKLHMLTRENIKKIVPDDVGEVTRDHFRLTRSINGAVTMSIRKGGE